jgi:2-methylcitrate dehydratase PrpD
VKLKNGRSLESQVMYPKGTRMNEMSFEEVCDKFDVLAQGIIDKRKISGIIEKVRILETLQNISELTELFVTTRKNQNNDL